MRSSGHPLFVKPPASCASYGIGLQSAVRSDAKAEARRDALCSGEFAKWLAGDTIFAEHFIDGAEYTMLMGGYWSDPDGI